MTSTSSEGKRWLGWIGIQSLRRVEIRSNHQKLQLVPIVGGIEDAIGAPENGVPGVTRRIGEAHSGSDVVPVGVHDAISHAAASRSHHLLDGRIKPLRLVGNVVGCLGVLVPHPKVQRQAGPHPPVVLQVPGPPIGAKVLRGVTDGSSGLVGITQQEVTQACSGEPPIETDRGNATEIRNLKKLLVNEIHPELHVVIGMDDAQIVDELVVFVQGPNRLAE